MNINKIKLLTLISLLPFNLASKELFFECDNSARGEPWIDIISIDTVSKTGTFEYGYPEYKKIMSFSRGGTILPTKITMSPETLFIKHPSMLNDSPAYTETKSINRETLAYADSIVVLGKCKIVEKELAF
tara:strand:+ start:50 stop:439 length:390 start_codon:yes stop_codon:yes gene_type:complete